MVLSSYIYELGDAVQAAEQVLDCVGMRHKKEQMVTLLSGGEKQRVAIARALVKAPKLFLADEPTGNLDDKNAEQVLDLLFAYQKENEMTSIIVTHNKRIAARCEVVYEMKDKKLVQVGGIYV